MRDAIKIPTSVLEIIWLYNHFSPVMQDEYVSNRLLFEEGRFRHTPAALIDCVITFIVAW